MTKWNHFHVCGRLPAYLVGRVNARTQGWGAFSAHPDRSVVRSRRLGIYGVFCDSFSWFLSDQPSDFAFQGKDHSRKPNEPLRRFVGPWEAAFRQHTCVQTDAQQGCGWTSLHDSLVSADIHPATANFCFVFFHLFGDSAYELAPRVHLQKLWSFLRPTFVNFLKNARHFSLWTVDHKPAINHRPSFKVYASFSLKRRGCKLFNETFFTTGWEMEMEDAYQ